MRAGELRHRISLQSPSKTRSATGAEVITYATVATVWAKIETVRSDEIMDQQRAGATATHKMTIRHRTDIKPTWQVVWGGRTLRVDAPVIADNVNRSLTLVCTEVVNG